MKNTTLESVLAYNNRDIVARFNKIYGTSSQEGEQIFDDVKRWLWLADQAMHREIKQGLVVDPSIAVIDEMWHNFVLFTKEYFEFCHQFFGRYMHHAPFAESEKAELEKSYEGMDNAERKLFMMDKKRWQYEFVYDELGEETFIRWYKQYPKKYHPYALAEMQFQAEKQRHDSKIQMMEKYREERLKTA